MQNYICHNRIKRENIRGNIVVKGNSEEAKENRRATRMRSQSYPK
jgi:hypothetical protein